MPDSESMYRQLGANTGGEVGQIVWIAGDYRYGELRGSDHDEGIHHIGRSCHGAGPSRRPAHYFIIRNDATTTQQSG